MQAAFTLKENESRLAEAYNILGHPALLKVGARDTNGQLSVFTGEYHKNQGPPLHLHDVDETFCILEGDFIFQAGDERFTVTAGDTVFVPRNMPHTYLTISETGKMIFMVNPSGTIELLFAKLSAYKESPPIVEEIVKLHEALGLKIVGPPITA